ncbi:MAG: hypothetical protein C4B59_08755 [Candidatus Methanogaster sp.]|uniref:Uncharacterized protein n=1 Tax=Candidatus Methanogaster sp. TaxID=3386292 RepID=A0AC61L2P0_9EURY|nr:MAG: hypothetical protein C4B59_08755 [ANME-2 cluster archaeon]
MKMTTTMVVCLIALAVFGMVLPAGAATSASIGSATSSTCDTVAITIDTDETAGIGSATFTVVYDTSKVSLNSVSSGALGTVTWADASGTVTMTATDALTCPTGNGITFADLEFCPVTGASGCSDLNLEVTSLYDCDVSSITPDSVNDGQFCISGGGPAATTVSIGSATSSTCDTVAITIDTDETAGIGSATFTVVYDTSKVSLNSVSSGALGTVTWADASGTVTMTATDALTCPTGNGITFADLEFCPVTGASGCSDLNLEVTSLYDCDVSSITPDSVNDGQFCIGAPNDPPTVTVTYPTSGTVKGPIDVTATATDTDGTVTQVAFYLMPAGTLINTPDTNGADGWSVSLDTTTAADGDYQIKAVATDDGGATDDDTGGVFEIDNSCPCDFCYDLVAGLNFVSIPKTLDSPKDTTTVFDVDYYSGEFCLYYDASAGSFYLNADVKPCRGYLVYKNAAKTVCVDFDDAAPAPSQQLYEGWNMIGHIKTVAMPINDGTTADFVSITGLEEPEGYELFRLMATYTAGTGWSEYPSGSLTEATPGTGYWIYMDQGATMSGGFE